MGVGPIRRRRTWEALRRPAGRSGRGPVRVVYVPVADPDRPGSAQVGYAIDRRCGNAVERNRLRRRMRAVTRQLAEELPSGAYVVRSDPEAAALGMTELRGAVREAMMGAARRAVRARDGGVAGGARPRAAAQVPDVAGSGPRSGEKILGSAG